MKDLYREIKLTPEELRLMARFQQSSDFQSLTDCIDRVLTARVFVLISSNLSREERTEELDNIVGGYDFWRYIKNLSQRAKEHEDKTINEEGVRNDSEETH